MYEILLFFTLCTKKRFFFFPARVTGIALNIYTHIYMQNMWASQVALVVNNPPANVGDTRNVSLITESGRSPGGGHGYTIQYSCWENPIDSGTIGLQRFRHNLSDTVQIHAYKIY